MSQLSKFLSISSAKVSTLWVRYFLAVLITLLGYSLPATAYADKNLDAQMAILYEQSFGEEFRKKSVKTGNKTASSRKVLAKKSAIKAVHTSNLKKPDLSALYSQAFNKSTTQTDKTSKDNTKKNKAVDLNDLFAKAFGKKAAVSAPSYVSVEVKVNKNVIGHTKIFSKNGIFDSVDSKSLLELLKKVLKEHVYKRVEKKLSKEKIPFKNLKELGISAAYNPSDISLDLSINSELRKPLVLTLQSKRKASVRDENKITAKEISAFLNMYSNVDFNSGSSDPKVKMKLEGSLNIKNVVLESTVNVRGGKFTTDKATLTYDDPDKLLRFSVGNVFTGTRNFQENLRLDGLRISKEFFFDPELQIRPRASESFILETDSEVEVFINEILRQRFYLKAGLYSLEDIGLYDGANDIRVRIKDEFGKITVKTSQQYYNSHLLKKGLSMYAISVGHLSNRQSGVNNKLITDPVISGYYQKGLTKNLTMSVDAQVSQNSYLLGTEFITSMSLGSIKSSWAISGGKSKNSGIATRFEFRPNRQPEKIGLDTLRHDMLALDKSIGGFFKSWTLSGEFRSKDFSLLNGSDSFDGEKNEDKKRLKARLQTNFSLKISDNWRGVLNLGATDYYNANQNFSANLTATRRFHNGMNLSLGARYDSDDDYSVNLQLSIPLFREKGKRKKSLDLLADTKNNSFETRVNLKPLSLVGRNSFGGSLEYTQDESSHLQSLDLTYRDPSFETKFTAKNRDTKHNNENYQHLSIGFNSSLACVGGSCATSYPIHDSFALVSGPSNQTTPIAINEGINRFKYSDGNNTGLPDNYTALIKSKKSKAVVRLESYRFQSINIDESTLPSGYDIEKTEFEVFPRYHQGFLIKAGGEPSTILNGLLRDDEGKKLGYKGGQWVPASKKGKTIAFFSNKAGRFRIISIPAGKYKLELFDYPDMEAINITVPDLKGKVHDIGDLVIRN